MSPWPLDGRTDLCVRQRHLLTCEKLTLRFKKHWIQCKGTVFFLMACFKALFVPLEWENLERIYSIAIH